MIAPGVVFGTSAGVLSVVDAVPYVRDILRGTTRPHRGTRLIWWTLATTALLSQYADGAGWSMLMLLGQAVTTGLTFALSIRRGVGGLSRLDLTITAIAGLGVVGWFVSSTPVIATACVVFADTLGVALMCPRRGEIRPRRRFPRTRWRAPPASSPPWPSVPSMHRSCSTRSISSS